MQLYATDPVITECVGLILARIRALSQPGALITVAEAADILNCEPTTVRVWVSRRRLRYVVGHMLLRQDVEVFAQRPPSGRGLHLRLPKQGPRARSGEAPGA
jgi:excisionase family DNA binding protein